MGGGLAPLLRAQRSGLADCGNPAGDALLPNDPGHGQRSAERLRSSGNRDVAAGPAASWAVAHDHIGPLLSHRSRSSSLSGALALGGALLRHGHADGEGVGDLALALPLTALAL